MDRFGLFIDTGYLYAASGHLVFGEKKRALLKIDFRNVTTSLAERAAEHSGLEHLRTYWYDAARNAIPTAAQLEVANLPGVKIRLGRLVRSGQKGVDSRIVRDLIILSQERAISVAYLLGADEDLREGVMEAQERGVRVVLMAIEPLKNNLSPTLAMEADDVIALGKDFAKQYISLMTPSVQDDPPVVHEVPNETELASVETAENTPHALGLSYGVAYLNRNGAHVVGALRRQHPRIPMALDRALLLRAAAQIGRPHLLDEERGEIRAGFWQAILASEIGKPLPAREPGSDKPTGEDHTS